MNRIAQLAKTSPRRILVANWMISRSMQRLLDGVMAFAAKRGLSWEIEALQIEQTDTMSLALETQRPDGVISGFGAPLNLAVLSRTSMPAVFLRHYAEEPAAGRRRLSVFRLDFGEVGRAAARHFLEQGGYRSFGFVEATRDPLWSRQRGDAFRDAIVAKGLPFFRYSTLSGTYQAAFANPNELSSLAEWLKTLPKPAAVFAAQDERARDTILACREAGFEVPLSVSVVGVNNDEFLCRHIFPNLSSVELDNEEMGRAAAAELLRLMEGGRPVRRDYDVPVLCVAARASSAPPSPSGVLVQRALDWIEAHACEGAGAADVAKALNVSRSLLDLRFRQLRGGTLLGAIHDRRLREVRRLLRETDDSIEAICAGAGFGEPAGLRHLFKRRFGLSMRQWRTEQRFQLTNKSAII
jgi:LacI family transcriptional regulator